jgi:hypothetical protein
LGSFCVFCAYWSLQGHRARLAVLLNASCVFYAAWYPSYLILLLGTTYLNHLAAGRLDPVGCCTGWT